MEIILATHNLDKCKELKKSFSNTSIKILTLQDFPEIKEIIEDGDTLEENAFIKSRTVFNFTKIPTISDDTGLEVDALNGEPGIYSARYAGSNCSYLDNVNKLLESMENIDDRLRTAKFRTAVTFINKDMELVAEGSVQGTITRKAKGNSGFGYDPIFYIPSYKKTFAEMTLDEKNNFSHRSRAIHNLQLLFKEHSLFNK
jgi:XTP/dITP diphosphohydrolase